MEPNETEICVCVETEITDEEHLIIDELIALMIRHETEEQLPFKKVDQRKLKDVTKKMNAVIIHIEIDITQTKKIAMTAALWFAKEVGVTKAKKQRKKSHGGKEGLKVILLT